MTKRHINLDDDLWHRTRLQAAIEGVPAQQLVTRALTQLLDPSIRPLPDARTPSQPETTNVPADFIRPFNTTAFTPVPKPKK